MMRIRGLFSFLLVPLACAQSPKAEDLTKPQNATLYVVGYAHLDTQWRWEFPQTISEYMLKTMRVNFDYLEKYPHYIFNWTGANRYRLMKEYFPSDFMKMKQYVAAGRWYPAGSSMEEGDVNAPSAEAILREILYGNTYFRKEFGVASAEYMLPDCFGFPASLPSILAHAGVKGFSTQKLSAAWQPAPHVGGPDSPEKTAGRNPVQRGDLERAGRRQRDCGAESAVLQQQCYLRSEQNAAARAEPRGAGRAPRRRGLGEADQPRRRGQRTVRGLSLCRNGRHRRRDE